MKTSFLLVGILACLSSGCANMRRKASTESPPVSGYSNASNQKMSLTEYPFAALSIDSASLSSSIDYNPYSEIVPSHQWELGINFKEIQLRQGDKAVSPFITYTINLGALPWPKLEGEYDLKSSDGSDFWHGDENLGPVELERVSFKHLRDARFLATAHLSFHFAEANYKPRAIQLEFEVEYAGFRFIAPLWNKPDEVSFPSSWAIPSAQPLWSDEEITNFVRGYVDLLDYREIRIEHSGTSTITLLP